ncbi:Crispr-associated helicase Cas3, partial [human gut metagenome]
SLFSTMFGENKEDAFAFHQLANSVIVLDEIQSYKNTIWTEIISFLKG